MCVCVCVCRDASHPSPRKPIVIAANRALALVHSAGRTVDPCVLGCAEFVALPLRGRQAMGHAAQCLVEVSVVVVVVGEDVVNRPPACSCALVSVGRLKVGEEA